MFKNLKNIFLLGIMPLILLAIWVFISILQDSGNNLLTIKSLHNDDVFIKNNNSGILKNQSVIANLKAEENNMGIISVRFHTFNRINDDEVVFRIKEFNKADWHYENVYKTDQFQWDEFFTFGFPIIFDSKDKRYVVEIESLHGGYDNAIAISKINPVIEAQYKFDRNMLLQDKLSLVQFLYKKTITSFSNINFVLKSLVFLLPLIYYLYWIIGARSTKHRKLALFTIYISVLTIYIIFVPIINRDIHLYLLILWFINIFIFKLESSISFFFALIYLILCAILVFMDLENSAEKSAIFVYFFLLSATFQLAYEHFKETKGLLTYKEISDQVIKRYRLIYKKGFHVKLFKVLTKIIDMAKRFLKAYFEKKTGSRAVLMLWILRMLLAIIIIFFVMNKSSVILLNVSGSINDILTLNNKSHSEIFIDKIEPGIVRIGDRVVITGNGFNKKIDNFASIITSQGSIRPDYSADNKFIFTMPIEWESGKLKVWLENGKDKSNIVELRLIDRLGSYSLEDIEYYTQIKYLSDEARNINEFRNYKFGTEYIGKVLRFVL